MPLFTLQTPFENLNGTVRQTTFGYPIVCYRSSRAGFVTRRWVNPSQTTSPTRAAVRANITAASEAWSALSASDAAEWNQFASTFQIFNRIGSPHYLSGSALFIHCCWYSSAAGVGTSISPPTKQAPSSQISLDAAMHGDPNALYFKGHLNELIYNRVFYRFSAPLTTPAQNARRSDCHCFTASGTFSQSFALNYSGVYLGGCDYTTHSWNVGDSLGVLLTPLTPEWLAGPTLFVPRIQIIPFVWP